MPLVPITIPRRNYRQLAFNGPFTSLPSLINPGPNFTVNPYLQLTCDGNLNDNVYSSLFLKADKSEFGIYFPAISYANHAGKLACYAKDLSSVVIGPYDLTASNLNQSLTVNAPSTTTVALGPTAGIPTNSFAKNATVTHNYGGFADCLTTGRGLIEYHTTNDFLSVVTVAGVYSNMCPNPNEISFGSASVITTNDGVNNYTLFNADPVGGSGYSYPLVKWQPTAYSPTGPFTSTAYQLSLSDSADDTMWQTNADWAVNGLLINGNCLNTFAQVFVDATHTTVFLFAKDYSWYDRIDIQFDGVSNPNGINYFQDINGIEYALGGVVTASLIQVGTSLVPGNLNLTNVFSLGCWSPCANLLYTEAA